MGLKLIATKPVFKVRSAVCKLKIRNCQTESIINHGQGEHVFSPG